jgi:hypothetical protein
MAGPKESWEQVGDRLSGLGLKLKLHFEQAADEGHTEDEDKVKDALRTVGDAVEQAFTAIGTAARDEAVRVDARETGRSVIEALDATFSELGDRFRATIKRDEASPDTGTTATGGDMEPGAMGDDISSGAPGAADGDGESEAMGDDTSGPR